MLTISRIISISLIATILGLAGCGDDEEAATSACVPGENQACLCAGGAPDGVQVCASDGLSWGVCDCGSTDSDTTDNTDSDTADDNSSDTTDATDSETTDATDSETADATDSDTYVFNCTDSHPDTAQDVSPTKGQCYDTVEGDGSGCYGVAMAGVCKPHFTECEANAACTAMEICNSNCNGMTGDSWQSCFDACVATNPKGMPRWEAQQHCLYCHACIEDCAQNAASRCN